MKRLLIFWIVSLGLAAGVAGAEDVYRWVDADGTVHYSDRPQDRPDNAETVQLPKAQTFTPSPVAAQSRTAGGESGAVAKVVYTELGIITPTPDQVLWGTGGQVQVSLELTPRLRPKHSVRLYLDNQLVEGEMDGTLQFKLSEVDRGTHALMAEVQDADGKTLIKSSPVTFTVQQQSLLNPNNLSNSIQGPTG